MVHLSIKKKVFLFCILLTIASCCGTIIYGNNKSQVYLHIYILKQQLHVIDIETNTVIKKYPIATGKLEAPSPVGCWKIISKGKWGEGFGTRWLGLNVPWGKYGIHGTNKPQSIGHSLSSGCIRMFNKDIEELYILVRHGTKVIIDGGADGPFYRGFKILHQGHKGADVYYFQVKLKELGYYDGPLNGIFTHYMKNSVIKFRADMGLPFRDDIDYNFNSTILNVSCE